MVGREATGSCMKLRSRYFILLANTNVNVGVVTCMHRGKKKPYEVTTTVPGQHSNDRLTVPVQSMMAMNRALQAPCPEYSK